MAKLLRWRLEEDCRVDRISMLQDEILGLILSSLTFKEATATSILSSRWRHLWTFTPKLDLDWTALLNKLKNNSSWGESELETLRYKYLRWVDKHFLNRRISSTDLSEFRVLFDLSESHKDWINDFLEYALSRKVQSLDLNLIEYSGCNRRLLNNKPCYSFPYKEGNFPNNLKLLKKLSMHLVNVSGEAVAFLLGNCRLLEQLSVSESKALSTLEVVRTSPVFKCLEISRCRNLKSVEIRESEVVCVKYCGEGVGSFRRFVVDDAPLLTELWVKAAPNDQIRGIFDLFRFVLPQLHKVKIYSMRSLDWENSTMMIRGVEIPYLKELVVVLGDGYDDKCSLLPILNLARLARRLQKFVIEASHQEMSPFRKDFLENGRDPMELDSRDRSFGGINLSGLGIFIGGTRDPMEYFGNDYLLNSSSLIFGDIRRQKMICSHIKEVEFVGYRGVLNHLQLIIRLVKHSAALESILVDPRSFELREQMRWDRIPRHKIEDEAFARVCAKKQLRKYVPSRINVNIL